MLAIGIYGADVGRLPRPGDGPWSWLVSVSYAGRVLRWCSDGGQDVELDGVLYPANAADFDGLTITDDLPIGAVGSPTRSVSVAVYMPAGVSVAKLERSGVKLSGAPVEVALLPDGGTISDRCVLLRGVVSEPTYGADDEPVLFTAREPEQQLDAYYPPDAARTVVPLDLRSIDGRPDWFEPSKITRTDLESLVEVGQVWPRVFGSPGSVVLTNGATSPRPASPAYVIAQQYDLGYSAIVWEAILVSYEHVDLTAGTNVTLIRKDDGYPGGIIRLSLPAKLGYDHRGVPFTYVEDQDVLAIAPGDLPIANQDPYDLLRMTDWYVAWGAFDTSVPGPAIDGTLTPSAGNVLSWLVSRSSLAWDVGRCRAAAAALEGYRFAGVIEAATTPIDWIADHVAGALPVYLTSGPLGLYPVVVPFGGDRAPPVASLTVDAATVVLPPGAVQVEADGEATEVSVSWCRDATNGAFYKRASRTGWTGENRSAGDAPWYADTLPSEDRPRRSVAFDLPYVWDDSTAMLVLDWLCWREMRPRRTVALDVDATRFGHLAVGDGVDLTADDLYLSGARCLVVSVARSSSPWWRVRVLPLDE